MFGQSMASRTQIGQLLHEEHMQTLAVLQKMEQFLSRQGSKAAPDLTSPQTRTLLDEFLSTLTNDISRHFGFEETHLFPALTARGEGMIAAFLAEEHGTILPLAEEMTKAGQAALGGSGFDAAGWKSFHAAAAELCEREMFHIQKEEMGLMMAISMLIDAAADASLAALYREWTGKA